MPSLYAVALCPSLGSMERLKLWRFIYGANKQINGVLKARSQCCLTLIANDDARLHLSIASRISRKNKKNKIIFLFLTKYELCCVNDNDVDVSFVFVCFFFETRRNSF